MDYPPHSFHMGLSHTRGEGGVMLDIKRIEPLLETLRKIWLEHPDYRLMQLLGNVYRGDPYYVEDDDLLQRLESTYLPERELEAP